MSQVAITFPTKKSTLKPCQQRPNVTCVLIVIVCIMCGLMAAVEVLKIHLPILFLSVASKQSSLEDHPDDSSENHHDGSPGSHHDWGYDLGDGPSTWSGTCHTGHRQSPVDINPDNYEITSMPEVSFVNYEKTGDLEFSNNGHTISVSGFENWSEKPGIFGADLDSTYRLVQFHLHWAQVDSDGSEHTVNRIHYPVEIHFVHAKEQYTLDQAFNHSDGLVVVGVFAADTPHSAPFEELYKYFSLVKNVDDKVTLKEFNLLSLLPSDKSSFYRYPGSLTTPPCNEAVQWIVLAVPISISPGQLTLLRQIGGNDGVPQNHNDRPVQEMDNRRILFRPGNLKS